VLTALGIAHLLLLTLWVEACLRALRAQTLPVPRPGEGAASLSVVVAARDEEPRIASFLESVLAQDHPDFEILVVDDRSCDDTAQAAEKAAAGDARVQVLRAGERPARWSGRLYAQHVGASRARGEWLLFLSADQRLAEPSFLRAIVSAASAPQRDAVSVVGPFPGSRWWQRAWLQPMFDNPLFWGTLLLVQRLRPRSVWLIGAPCMPRALYHEVGGAEAATREAGMYDDMGWSRVLVRHGRRGELLYAPALRDVSNWEDVGAFYEAMVRWFVGIATYRRGGWLAVGGVALVIALLLGCCLRVGLDLASGQPPAPGLLLLAASGLPIAWGYRRFSGAPRWSYAVFYAVGPGVVALTLSAAFARLRGRVIWRGSALSVLPPREPERDPRGG
jgi:hypothetical protein